MLINFQISNVLSKHIFQEILPYFEQRFQNSGEYYEYYKIK